MSCILSYIGKDFDPDNFAEQTGLDPFKISRKGEQPTHNGKPYGRIKPYSFVSLNASDSSSNDFKQQLQDVILYMKNNYQQLERAKNISGIEYATLNFGVKFNSDKPTQSFWFTPDLVALAGELGISIELSAYNDAFFESSNAGRSEPD